MSVFYTNKFGVQINDVVRLLCIDERPGIMDSFVRETSVVSNCVTEIVISIPNARALRDLLVTQLGPHEPAKTGDTVQ